MPDWIKETEEAFGDIEPLECLRPMVWYFRLVRSTIRHLAGDERFEGSDCLARLNFDQVREIRRFINTDLHNYSIEFYLQRKRWARLVREPSNRGQQLAARAQTPDVASSWPRNPSQDPRQMKRGFRWIADGDDEGLYTYEHFLAETHTFFVAIHAHLVSINRALGDLHYFATELPFPEFTPVGKSEILHLTSELDRVMTGLLAATHLQSHRHWQSDLVNYLISCRTDCQRFFETIPRYYQSHRLRLIIFPIDAPAPENDPESTRTSHGLPIPCLPLSAGVYMDFLSSYQNIVQHSMAVIHWALRLYSQWYFVPRRVLRVISPVLRV